MNVEQKQIKQKTHVVRNDIKKYKFYRNILAPISFLSFCVSPVLSIPTLRLSRYYNGKIKEEEETDIFGRKLVRVGKGHGDYSNIYKPKHRNGIFIGVDSYGLPIHISDEERGTHGVIFGTTGSGKTTTIFSMIKQQIIQSGGFIFIDGKSENPTWGQFYDLMKEEGREDELFLLSFRGSIESKSNTWNILKTGNSTQLNEIVCGLSLPRDGGGDNRVFITRRKERMGVYLGVVVYLRDVLNKRVKISDLRRMLNENRLRRMLRPSKEDRLKDKDLAPFREFWIPEDYVEVGSSIPLKETMRNYRSPLGVDRNGFVRGEGKKLFKEQLSFLTMQFSSDLKTLSDDYGQIFDNETSDIDMTDLVVNSRCLYVLLPRLEKNEESRKMLGKLSLVGVKLRRSQTLGGKTEGQRRLFNKQTRLTRSNPGYLVIRDEYGSYRIRGFSDLLRQRRSLGITIFISIQEKVSLEKRGKDERERILGNTTNKLFLKLENLDTIEYRVKTRGETLVEVKKEMYGENLGNQTNQQKERLVDIELMKQFEKGRRYFISGKHIRVYQTPWEEPENMSDISLNEVRRIKPYR